MHSAYSAREDAIYVSMFTIQPHVFRFSRAVDRLLVALLSRRRPPSVQSRVREQNRPCVAQTSRRTFWHPSRPVKLPAPKEPALRAWIAPVRLRLRSVTALNQSSARGVLKCPNVPMSPYTSLYMLVAM